jgi:hypothetical protein
MGSDDRLSISLGSNPDDEIILIYPTGHIALEHETDTTEHFLFH